MERNFQAHCASLQDAMRQWYLLELLLSDEDLEAFKRDGNGDLVGWAELPKPSLLVVYGENNESIFYDRHCWVSPVAVNRIKCLRSADNYSPYAFFVFRNEDILYDEVISTVLLQLLKTRIEAFRDRHERDELVALLRQTGAAAEADKRACSTSPANWSSRSNPPRVTRSNRITALHKVAIRVIRMFTSSETVDIVVDRLDLCRARQGEVEVDHRKQVLETLTKMVEEAEARVRVMVIVKSHGWQELQDDDIQERIVLDVRRQRIRR